MSAPALPPLREVIARHGITARKSLGQNFLLDLNLTGRIARAAQITGRRVLEIGPGPGGLTRALIDAGAAEVIAVERDPRCLGALAEIATAFPGRLTVREADALDLDEAELAAGERLSVVANLPYNIGTALLLKWLGRPGWWDSLTLMFQKEVAERLAAAPGHKAYGRLSVWTQWRATVRRLFDVDPRAFVPPPKVTSTVVRLEPRPAPAAPADPQALERVLAAAFGQRRKMLRQSLKALGPDSEALLACAGIASTRRAEELSIAEFCALARAFAPTATRGAA
jgi:16S rRNA (adenine1518-N6/adenine1519-N6)-dimethyltransferase